MKYFLFIHLFKFFESLYYNVSKLKGFYYISYQFKLCLKFNNFKSYLYVYFYFYLFQYFFYFNCNELISKKSLNSNLAKNCQFFLLFRDEKMLKYFKILLFEQPYI